MAEAWIIKSPEPLAMFQKELKVQLLLFKFLLSTCAIKSPLSFLQSMLLINEGKHLWELQRFPTALYDEFVGLLLLYLQTAGTPQRAESLERMTLEQANYLLDWGLVKLDVSIRAWSRRKMIFTLSVVCFVGEQGKLFLLLRHVYSRRRCLDNHGAVCEVHARHWPQPPLSLSTCAS